MTSRNSSIELLKIISEIGVILLHLNNVNGGGGFAFVHKNSINYYFLLLIECIFICAVDVFVISSSYFLSNTNKRKLSKILSLLLQYSFIKGTLYLLIDSRLVQDPKMIDYIFAFLPSGYFFVLYSVLYIVSPYINNSLNNLNQNQQKKMVYVMFIIFSVYSFGINLVGYFNVPQSMSPVGLYGDQEGYTIVNFILLYLIGAYIRNCKVHIPQRRIITYSLIVLMLNYVLSIITSRALSYNNPLTIIFASLIFIAFSRHSFNCKIINELTKASFTCYILHSPFIVLLRSTTKQTVNTTICNIVCYYLITSVSLFLLSYIVYKIYNFIEKKTIKPLLIKIDKYDVYK